MYKIWQFNVLLSGVVYPSTSFQDLKVMVWCGQILVRQDDIDFLLLNALQQTNHRRKDVSLKQTSRAGK